MITYYIINTSIIKIVQHYLINKVQFESNYVLVGT
jgi:hypothetical protein